MNEIFIIFEKPWMNNPFELKEETPYEIFRHSGWI